MTDRKEIIQHLKIIRTWAKVNPEYRKGLDMHACRKTVEWIDDTLQMMQPVEPKHLPAGEFCGACDGFLHWYDSFCPKCGTEVKRHGT